jgi:hypothetical protein
VATTLSVFKPWGLTSYGRAAIAIEANPTAIPRVSSLRRVIWLLALLAAVALFVILHLASGGMHHH